MRRFALWIAGFSLLAAVSAGTGAWLIARTDTAVWVFTKAAAYAGARLKIGGAKGSLLSGFAADLVEIIHPDGRIGIRGLSASWESLAGLLMHRQFILTALTIDRLELEQASATSQTRAPPASLQLPIALRADRIEIGSIVIRQGAAHTALSALAARVAIDAAAIELWIDTITTPVGSIVAHTRIGAEAPFPIEGAITIANQHANLPYQAAASIGGELALIGVGGTASVELGSARAALVLTPFSETLLERIEASTERVDPAKIRAGWPRAALDIRLRGGMRDPTRFRGDIEIDNREAGLLDGERVPVRSLAASVDWTGTEILINGIKADLGPAGRVQGTGRVAQAAAHLDLATKDLNLAGLHTKLNATRLAGTVGGDLTAATRRFRGTLQDARLAVDFDIEHGADRIAVHTLTMRAGAGRIEAVGAVALTGEMPFKAKGRIANFDPAVLGLFESAILNADFNAEGKAGGDPSGNGRIVIRDSRLRGHPIEGSAVIDVGEARIRAMDMDLSIAGNTVQAKGVLGRPADTLDWRIDAQHLGRLGTGITGSMQASGVAQGSLAEIETTFTGNGTALALPGGVRIGALSATGRWSKTSAEVRASAQAVTIGENIQDTVAVTAAGTLERHTLEVTTTGPRLTGRAAASGGLADDSSWRGMLTEAAFDAPVTASLQSPAPFEASARRIALRQAPFRAGEGTIHIEALAIEGEALISQGRFSNLMIGDITHVPPALKNDLALAGAWDITSRESLNGSLSIHREKGDVAVEIGDASVTLGLAAARLDLIARQGDIEATATMQGARLGEMTGRIATRVAKQGVGWTLPDSSPLNGELSLDAKTIAWLGALSGGAAVVDGQVKASVRLSGTIGHPRPVGTVRGEQLRLAFPEESIALTKGTLEGTFDPSRFNLVQSTFHGDAGSIRASGSVALAAPLAGEILLDFDRLDAISDPSQSFKLSGQLRARFTDASIALTGSLRVTEGRIRIADASVPKLGEDVVVKRAVARDRSTRAPSGGRAIKLIADIDVDLGERFAFEGRGVKAILSGRMRVQTAASGALRITGTVRVEEGTVTAYGKSLDIDKGSIIFTGPIDNPQLNLTATRRGLPYRVGVQVTGFALQPRAALFSDTPMPNSERLSWLILGRSSEGLPATDLTLLSTAASAVLADPTEAPLQSRVAGRLGLDDLAVRTTGDVESSVVAIGKRLSDKLYVSVERNLVGVGTALALRYQFNKNWSLQGQTGLNNTINLLYTVSFD